jgi:hypothetical protein
MNAGHGSGPMWVATPSLVSDSPRLLLAGLPAHSQDKRTVARRLAEAEAMPALRAVYRNAEFNLRVRVDPEQLNCFRRGRCGQAVASVARPKAKVTRSNRVARANIISGLANRF